MTNITRKDFAIQMQIRIALMRPRYRQEGDPQEYILTARWYYWLSKYSANPAESLDVAKNQYRLARDMQADPEYYARRPGGMSCWLWFQQKPDNKSSPH